MGDTGLSDEGASTRVSNHGILSSSDIENAILEDQASKSTSCGKDDQNSCNTSTELSGFSNLSLCYISSIVHEADQRISNVSGHGDQPSCNTSTCPGLSDQPSCNTSTCLGPGDQPSCNTSVCPGLYDQLSCNAPMVTNLSDVSSSDTDDLEDTEELDNDEPEGVKDFFKNKYRQIKKALRRPAKRERPHNVATTNDEENRSVIDEVAPAVEDPDVYNFSHSRRGLAVIIDNENFTSASGMPSRPGSHEDLKALKNMFNRLEFEVKCYKDLKGEDMRKVLAKAAAWKWHKDSDCLAVAILSHGDEIKWRQHWNHRKEIVRRDLVFGVDGQFVLTSSIMDCFNDENCPALKGKPRLFFLQACRGMKKDLGQDIAVVSYEQGGLQKDLQAAWGGWGLDRGDTVEQSQTDARPKQGQVTCNTSSGHATSHGHRNDASEDERDETDGSTPAVSPAPIYNDFLVMYATVPGYFAWRRPTGSWFVQSLCAVFELYEPRMSLIQALTRVTYNVTTWYQSENKNNPRDSGMKQTPVIQTRLLKDVYFT